MAIDTKTQETLKNQKHQSMRRGGSPEPSCQLPTTPAYTYLIPLTQGKFAIVDAEDYEWLSQYKWYAVRDHRTFYAMRTDRTSGKKVNIRMHREILNVPKEKLTDHKNCKGYDNRRCNLRICSYSQNAFNKRPCRNSSSKYKGVYWRKDRRKWSVEIRYNGKRICLGCFNSEIECAKRYDIKAKELFGEFAYVNF